MIHSGIALGILAAATATAQGFGGGSTVGAVTSQRVAVTTFSSLAGPIGPLSRITGQPFSAQEETETIQTLSDGTRITQPRQKVTFFRDSLGRTRTERTPPAPPGLAAASSAPTVINIEDSVAGYRYSFDTNSHAAHRTPIAPIRVTKGEVAAPTSSNAVQGASTATSGRFQAAGANASQPRPEISNEQLGTQTMEGVLADGVRTTTTWPVGFFGNDRPVSSIRETWTSRELGMAVLSKSSDPRYGDTTTKVTNIQRAEPDPSLFQPPAGYEIVDPQVTQQR